MIGATTSSLVSRYSWLRTSSSESTPSSSSAAPGSTSAVSTTSGWEGVRALSTRLTPWISSIRRPTGSECALVQ